MQEAHDPAGNQTPAGSALRGGLSPGKSFLLVLGGLLMVGIVLAVTRPSEETPPAAPPTTDAAEGFALTDAEAIARFEELVRDFRNIYASRDESLLSQVFVSDSPLKQSTLADINKLSRDGVFYRPEIETREIEVVSTDSNEILIRQVVVQEPRFFTDSGKRIGKKSQLLQTIEWTLHPDRTLWKLFDSEVLDTQKIEEASS